MLDPITGETFEMKGSSNYDDWMDILKKKHSSKAVLDAKKSLILRK